MASDLATLIGKGVALTTPTADGTSGQAIVTNGSKVLSFATVGASAPLTLTAATDVIPLKLVLNASQTVNAFEINTSAGSGGDHVVVNATGKVGLGVTTVGGFSLDTLLHLKGAGTNPSGRTNLTIENTAADSAALLYLRNSAGKGLLVQCSGPSYVTGPAASFGASDGLDLVFIAGSDVTSGGLNSVIFRVGGYNTSNNRVWFKNDGTVGIGSSTTGAKLAITLTATTTIGQIIKLAAAHTANAFEINSSAGSGGDIFKITKDGYPSGSGWGVDASAGFVRLHNGSGGVIALFQAAKMQLNAQSLFVETFSTYIQWNCGGTRAFLFRPTSNETYFGNGLVHATPTANALKATGGSGTDIAGASLTIAGGQGTGTGAGGSLSFQTAPVGTTGSSLNALVTALQVDASVTAGNTRMLVYDVTAAALVRVSVGATDSGGSGFKVLRVPN